MKILIPTDFSKLAEVAGNYAVKMANKAKAEVILLHAVFIDAPPRAQVALKTNQILEAMVESATQDMEQLVETLRKEIGGEPTLSYNITKGDSVKSVVDKFVQDNQVDLIIMGTKGASGLKKVLMGSNTNAVISHLDIPVIAVPEHARFGNLKHIVYASDLLAVTKEMEELVQFAQLFDAIIHLLHIESPDSEQKIDGSVLKAELINQFQYPHISVKIIVNEHLEEAIDEYLADIKADLLAMFTHKPSFFEKLFGESLTREMAFQNWIPLLAIKK
ncbi:MAG: universal stress protein [Saprospiraceae bacterium]|nr:universal stress protein [Saprospiraceae bacterium]